MLNGRLVSIWCDLVSQPENPINMTGCRIDFSPRRLLEIIAKRNPHKGLGPNCIPASLLAAGGFPKLAGMITSRCLWRVAVNRCRLVDLFKGKDDWTVCDNSRGLTVWDRQCSDTSIEGCHRSFLSCRHARVSMRGNERGWDRLRAPPGLEHH